MTALKRLSLGLGVGSSAVTAGFLALSVGPAWAHAGGSYADLALSGGCVGALVGGMLWLMASTHEAELRRALAAATNGSASPFRSHFGLDALVTACQQAAQPLRARLKEVVAARRDLEAHVGVEDAQRRILEAIAATINDAVLVVDAFDGVVYANAASTELFGSALARQRKPVDQAINDPTIVRLVRDTREAARHQPGLRRQVQHRVVRGDRSSVYQVTLKAVSEPVAEPGATPRCVDVVVVLRDVSDAVENVEERSEFVARLSHELRTPLSSIRGSLEMLVDGEADDAQSRDDLYNIIASQTGRLVGLIDDILTLSRIESGAAKPRHERFDIRVLLDEAAATSAPEARAKRLLMSWRRPDEEMLVTGDREMLLQAIRNVIDNAIRFTPEGGEVSVSARPDPSLGSINVVVSDTGVGIPEDALPFVFDKFFRVPDHTRIAKGAGLGLNLVKHVVRTVHAGAVRAESIPGKGSTFTLTLPRADTLCGVASAASAVADRAPSGAGEEL